MSYGDTEPEDVYDGGDPPDIRLSVLARVIAALAADPDADRRARRRRAAVERIRQVADQVSQHG